MQGQQVGKQAQRSSDFSVSEVGFTEAYASRGLELPSAPRRASLDIWVIDQGWDLCSLLGFESACGGLLVSLSYPAFGSTHPPPPLSPRRGDIALKREFLQSWVPKQMSTVLPPSLLTHRVRGCVCVQGHRESVEGHACCGAYVEVRVQLAGVIFLVYYVEPRDPTRAIRLNGKLLHLWTHVTCPVCQVLKVLTSR